MNGNQITAVAIVLIVAVAVLVGLGKVSIPEGAVDKIASALVTFVLGLGLPQPDALKRLLGVPVYPAPVEPKEPS